MYYYYQTSEGFSVKSTCYDKHSELWIQPFYAPWGKHVKYWSLSILKHKYSYPIPVHTLNQSHTREKATSIIINNRLFNTHFSETMSMSKYHFLLQNISTLGAHSNERKWNKEIPLPEIWSFSSRNVISIATYLPINDTSFEEWQICFVFFYCAYNN